MYYRQLQVERIARLHLTRLRPITLTNTINYIFESKLIKYFGLIILYDLYGPQGKLGQYVKSGKSYLKVLLARSKSDADHHLSRCDCLMKQQRLINNSCHATTTEASGRIKAFPARVSCF
jgi:hypothetical protein